MAWHMILITLAAWGLLCAFWAAAGWLLEGTGSIHLYFCPSGSHPDGCIRRHCWLRSLGLLTGPLLIVGSAASETEQAIIREKHPFVEFYEPEELSSRLELERKNLG